MKNIIGLLLLMLLATGGFTQSRTFILVRHAEKVTTMLADPALTVEGTKNSEALAQLLQHLEFDGVYSTPYIRTEKTVTPLATLKNLPVEFYQPTEGVILLDKLLASGQSENDYTYLIAGHSNTIPRLVNHLLGEDKLGPMPETDYGKVFIIIFKEKEAPSLMTLQLPKATIAP